MDDYPNRFLNEDLQNMCRLCWDKCTVYFSVFDNQAAEMLEALTSIKVNCNDSSSKILCSRCLIELRNAYQTQQKFIKVERLLLEKLSKKLQSVQETEKSGEEIIISDVDYDEEKQSLEVSSVDNTDNVSENLKLDAIDIEYECARCPENFSDTDTADYVNHLDRKQHSAGFFEQVSSVSKSMDKEAAENATLNRIPAKSRSIYERTYNEFLNWCKMKKIKTVNENVLLVYFNEKSKVCKSSSLWPRYSMIRANLAAKENIDISKFKRLCAFLKRQSVGYKPKKSKVFSREQIMKLFVEAPDNTFLMIKVAVIMGIFGACRIDELTQLTLDDIEDAGCVLIVEIRNTITNIGRTFTVINSGEIEVDFLELFRKYVSLRPPHTEHRRLFIYYKNGKCTSQVVGKNTLGQIPQTVAKFLKLPDASAYTGHCFRRSSATLSVGGGADENSEKANNIKSASLPAKSSERYLKEYKLFCDWRESNHIIGVNEKVMLTYFEEKYKNAKSSCLWAYYAMIRSCLLIHEKVDIKRFGELRQYLKRKTAGWKPKRSKALSQVDIIRFLREADDDRYLLLKVILILGTFGGCGREELVSVTTDDVKDCGNFIKVRISKTTTGVCRSFVITEEEEGCHACMIIRKYMSLRPDGLHNKRFLIGYRNKKCVSQVVGVHTVGNAPKKIAKYLGLPNADQYTGHCFRRSSASLFVEGRGNLGILINHGGWNATRSARK